MTRVVTQVLGGEGGPNYEEYKTWAGKAGAPVRGAHDVHHKGTGNRGVDNSDTKVLGYRDEMFCTCLARLVDKLHAIQAHEGTLLDHTVLLLGGSQNNQPLGFELSPVAGGRRQAGLQARPAPEVEKE